MNAAALLRTRALRDTVETAAARIMNALASALDDQVVLDRELVLDVLDALAQVAGFLAGVIAAAAANENNPRKH